MGWRALVAWNIWERSGLMDTAAMPDDRPIELGTASEATQAAGQHVLESQQSLYDLPGICAD